MVGYGMFRCHQLRGSLHFCHGCNLERVGAVELARRCSKEQETIYTRMEYIHGVVDQLLSVHAKQVGEYLSEYVEVTGLTRDNFRSLHSSRRPHLSRLRFRHRFCKDTEP
jgi:hypothetical protein